MKSKTLRNLVLAAMFIALDIVFTRLLSWYAPTVPPGLVRIGPQFLVHGLCGWLLGPIWSVLSCIAADLLGIMMFPSPFPFFPGYTLSTALNGLIYGLLLYRKPIRLWRTMGATVGSAILISLALNSIWTYFLQGSAWWGNLITALPWRLALMVVYGAALFGMQKALSKPLRRNGTWL